MLGEEWFDGFVYNEVNEDDEEDFDEDEDLDEDE
jgi:hypothetical protein